MEVVVLFRLWCVCSSVCFKNKLSGNVPQFFFSFLLLQLLFISFWCGSTWPAANRIHSLIRVLL